jgi:hypothetical protein
MRALEFIEADTNTKTYQVITQDKRMNYFVALTIVGEFFLNQLFDIANPIGGFSFIDLLYIIIHTVYYILSLIFLVNATLQIRDYETINSKNVILKSLKQLKRVSPKDFTTTLFQVFFYGLILSLISSSVSIIEIIFIMLLIYAPSLCKSLYQRVWQWRWSDFCIQSALHHVQIFFVTLMKLISVSLLKCFLPFGADELSNIIFLPIIVYFIILEENREKRERGQTPFSFNLK